MTIKTIKEQAELFGINSVVCSLMEKEAFISMLKKKVLEKQLIEGSLQTERDIKIYVEAFIDCYNMLK